MPMSLRTQSSMQVIASLVKSKVLRSDEVDQGKEGQEGVSAHEMLLLKRDVPVYCSKSRFLRSSRRVKGRRLRGAWG